MKTAKKNNKRGPVFLCIVAVLATACLVLCGCASSTSSRGEGGENKSSGPIKEKIVIPTDELMARENGSDRPAETASEKKTNDPAAAGESVQPTEEDLSSEPEYRISAGDVLTFRSFDDETLSAPQVLVRYDGYVSLPLIQDIRVGGDTRDEALGKVREEYKKVFKDPQVSLVVSNAVGQSFYVLGDVNRPAEYPYKRSLNVLQAVNIAGGVSDRSRATGELYPGLQGSLSVAYIIRHYGGGRRVIMCDLKALTNTGPHPSQIRVWPEDVVYLPEGINLVYIMGAVVRPSVVTLTEGETLLKVLARVGGLQEPAAYMRHIVLIRGVSETESEVMLIDVKKILKTGEDIQLRAGDVVYVPRKPLLRLQDFAQRLTGSITPYMNLYRDAFETYYTRKRFDRLFENAQDGTQGTLQVLQGLRDFGSLFRTYPTVTTTPTVR